jgi:hypothetical protein
LLTAAPQFLTPWIIISDSKSRLIRCKITFKCASSLRLTPVAAVAVLHLFVFFFSPYFLPQPRWPDYQQVQMTADFLFSFFLILTPRPPNQHDSEHRVRPRRQA